jgi:hypothetical protein
MRFGQESNDDDQEDVEHFFNEDDDFDEDMQDEMTYQENLEIKMAELALVEANLNRRILSNAIKMLENSFLWKFVSYKTKLKMISESYKVFSQLIANQNEIEEKSKN